MEALQAEVASALARWREVTAPLDHAHVERDAQLIATPLRGLLSTRSAVSPLSPQDDAPPPCRAWSHGDFLQRVATFRVATWFDKPLCLSPLACARFGWVNTARDLLTCRHCARVLCCAIDATLSSRGVAVVAARFASELETAHDVACPWSHNASPESFTMLPLLGPSQVAESLCERTQTLLDTASSRHAVQLALATMCVRDDAVTKLLVLAGFDETTLIATLTKRLKAAPVEESTGAGDARVLVNAALLSVCGWTMHDKHGDAAVVASCDYCNRHVSMSVASLPARPAMGNNTETAAEEKQEDGNDAEEKDEAAPPAKRQRVAVGNVATVSSTKPFDPITEHRWFCPWVVPQRRRDADDDQRIHDVMTRVCDHQKQQPEDVSLAAFVVLPGWRQCAVALRHLHASSTTRDGASSSLSALDALASVQSVLGLSDSYHY